MPTVLITPTAFHQKPGPFVDMLEQAGFDVRYPKDPFFTRGLGPESESIEEFAGIVAVIAGGEFITANVIKASTDLRVIARCGVGFDRVDIPVATEHRIPVTITPTANHEGVAEHAFSLIFSVAKAIALGDRRIRRGEWVQNLTRPIRGTTLGIMGLGRIGRSTALRGKALGMNVIATEQFPNEEFVRENGIELVDFEELQTRSDYLSIHCPLNDETTGMFNRDVFARMKEGSVIINTARGGIINEADLIEALQTGTIAAAGLDVFEQEPPAKDNPLFLLDNVVLAPHLAGTDTRSMEDMGIESADNIIKLSRGEWPDGAVVNDELKEGWQW